jgi:hexokinase
MEMADDFTSQAASRIKQLLDEPECRLDPVMAPGVALQGTAAALDLGGSRVRAALVGWIDGHMRVEKGPLTAEMPWRRGVVFDRERFLDIQADLVERLRAPLGLPLGYCFSFPTRPTPDGDARLVRWTKGIEVPDTLGRRMGHLLAHRLSQRGRFTCGPVRVLNDSVALLHAAAGRAEVDLRIALVVGTGTNLAVAWPMGAQSPAAGETALTLEAGRFAPRHLTDWDAALDAASENPGAQRLEKAVSGLYLDRLLARVAAARGLDGPQSLAAMTRADRVREARTVLLGRSLVRRSAMIVAALTVSIIELRHRLSPVSEVRVAAEGGLFWSRFGGDWLYFETAARTIAELLSARGLGHVQVALGAVANATLVGAARAVLTAK